MKTFASVITDVIGKKIKRSNFKLAKFDFYRTHYLLIRILGNILKTHDM